MRSRIVVELRIQCKNLGRVHIEQPLDVRHFRSVGCHLMRSVIRLLYRQRAKFLGMLAVASDISTAWRQRVRQGIFMEWADVRLAGGGYSFGRSRVCRRLLGRFSLDFGEQPRGESIRDETARI